MRSYFNMLMEILIFVRLKFN